MSLVPTIDMTSSDQSRPYWTRSIIDWIYKQIKPTSIADLLVDYQHLASYLSTNRDEIVTVLLRISNTKYYTVTTLHTEISPSSILCDMDCNYFITVVPDGYIYIQKANTNTLYSVDDVYPYVHENK